MMADILSQVTTQLDLETVKSILDGVTLGMVHHAKVDDLAVVEDGQCLEQKVSVAAGCPLVEMHVTDWSEAQREDLMLNTVPDWLKAHKQTDLRMPVVEQTSSEEGKLILQNWQNFTIHQRALYVHSMPRGRTEDLLLLWSPRHTVLPLWVGATEMQVIKGKTVCCPCCRNTSGGWEYDQVLKSLKSCTHCLQHEGQLSKVPLHLIVSTTAMDLLHVDFTSIEMTMEPNRPPKVANILVFQNHFTKHVMVYVTPNQTAKTVAKFLYQGYSSIFGALASLLSDCGMNFMGNNSHLVRKMCKLLGMKKLQTTPYHPQMNRLVERSH